MYCVKCGVQLADTEKRCPLCQTAVYHPDIIQPEAEAEYPKKKMPDKGKQNRVACFIITAFFLIALFIIPLCDMQFDRTVDWAGFATGGILLLYEIFVLPFWFKRPNPVIFVPCGFGAVLLTGIFALRALSLFGIYPAAVVAVALALFLVSL